MIVYQKCEECCKWSKELEWGEEELEAHWCDMGCGTHLGVTCPLCGHWHDMTEEDGPEQELRVE